MPKKFNYGPTPKKRCRQVLTALLKFANGEIGDETAPTLKRLEKEGLKAVWSDWDSSDPELEVWGTQKLIGDLVKVDQPDDSPPTTTQIGHILNHYLGKDYLGILTHHLKPGKGQIKRHFTLNLWSLELEENLRQFDQAWDVAHPQNSKSNPSTPDRVSPSGAIPPPAICKFNRAPSLPTNFVPRSEHQAAVKELLLTDQPDQSHTYVVSAIYGLGGIGKSVLAMALANDPEIQARFADGILWATLGQNPDILPILSRWIQALGDYNYKPLDINAASAHLRTLLSGVETGMLLVVDDLWQAQHFEPFRVGNPKCCLLVTTREAVISGKATPYELDVMSPAQSMELLNRSLNEAISPTDLEDVEALIKAVGYLPLALELLAARRNEGLPWARLRKEFEQEYDRRFKLLKRTNAESQGTAEAIRNLSLEVSFSLSLRSLRKTAPEIYAYFLWFGVLPEDVTINENMAPTLWDCSDWDAGEALRLLKAKALLRDGKVQGAMPSYRLHDLMHDYARKLLPTSPDVVSDSPEQLPGLGLCLEEAHGQLLERYRQQTQNGLWHTLQDDNYIYAHLTWHMEQAGQVEAVHDLLQETTEEGRNAWYEACDALGQPAQFVSDLGRAWELAEKSYTEDPPSSIVLQCHYGLIKTSLNSLAKDIPAELIAAFVKNGFWSAAQGLAYAQKAQEAGTKASVIQALAPHLPKSLISKTLELVRAIHSESEQSSALIALAEKLPELYEETLAVMRQIQDELNRADALCAFVEILPEALYSKALAMTHQIKNESVQSRTLRVLAKKMPEALYPKTLVVTRQIQDKFNQANALIALTEKMPELYPETLAVIRQIKDEVNRANALIALAEKMPELYPEALEATRQIQAKSDRVTALCALAEKMPELYPEALTVTRQIQDESAQAIALRALAAKMPQALIPETLEMIQQFHNRERQLRVLHALAEKLPKAYVLEMFASVQRRLHSDSILDSLVAYELSVLAKNMPKTLLVEVLEVIQHILNSDGRAAVLCAIAEKLPEALYPQALAITHQMGSGYYRVRALRALTEKLPEALYPQALAITRQVQDEFARAIALSKLAEKLPELYPEALAITRQIQDEADRATALCIFVSEIPEALIPEVVVAIKQMRYAVNRAKVLCTLTEQLPELYPEALIEINQSYFSGNQASLLGFLIRKMPKALIPEAIDVTRQISHEFFRAQVLCALAKKLTELYPEAPKLYSEALAVTRQIHDESLRANVLIALVEQLPELYPEALAVTRQIQDTSDRANALIVLAEKMPELYPEALEATRQIQDRVDRVKALCKLAEKLPNSYQEALAIVHQFYNENQRTIALEVLAKKLPGALIPEVLAITDQIQHDGRRSYVFRAFSEHCSDRWIPTLLEKAHQLNDFYFRAGVFSALLPRLALDKIDPPFWKELLATLTCRTRKEFIEDIPKLAPVIVALGGEEALRGVVESMRQVGGWWP
jgi:hypothetical protein